MPNSKKPAAEPIHPSPSCFSMVLFRPRAMRRVSSRSASKAGLASLPPANHMLLSRRANRFGFFFSTPHMCASCSGVVAAREPHAAQPPREQVRVLLLHTAHVRLVLRRARLQRQRLRQLFVQQALVLYRVRTTQVV